MNLLKALIPPSDLLTNLEGVQKGLTQINKFGRASWALVGLGVIAQAAVVLTESDLLTKLPEAYATIKGNWEYLLPLMVSAVALLLASAFDHWIKESRSPLRYTISIAPFNAVDSREKIKPLLI